MKKVKRIGLGLGVAGLGVLWLALHGWVAAALYFWFSSHAGAAGAVVALYVVAVGILFKLARRWWEGAVVGLVLALVVGIWWAQRRPEPGLRYARETEQAAKVVVEGESLTVHGIRDFRSQRSGEVEPRWATRTFDLPQLQHVDFLFGEDESGEQVVASFVFGDQPPLAVSVQGRAEVGEPQTWARGFFRQYELGYVWADERDAVPRLSRDGKRPVYLRRSTILPEQGRRLLLELAQRSNALEESPEFYNPLTDSGGKALAELAAEAVGAARPWYRRLPWPGNGAGLAGQAGWLEPDGTGGALPDAAEIGERARQGGDSPDFSQRIRSHLAAPALPEPEEAP